MGGTKNGRLEWETPSSYQRRVQLSEYGKFAFSMHLKKDWADITMPEHLRATDSRSNWRTLSVLSVISLHPTPTIEDDDDAVENYRAWTSPCLWKRFVLLQRWLYVCLQTFNICVRCLTIINFTNCAPIHQLQCQPNTSLHIRYFQLQLRYTANIYVIQSRLEEVQDPPWKIQLHLPIRFISPSDVLRVAWLYNISLYTSNHEWPDDCV